MNEEIRIYQSIWKNLLLGIVSLLFAYGIWVAIKNDDGSLGFFKEMIGWIGVVFAGFGGAFIIVITLFNRCINRPALIIYKDRVDFYVLIKGAYVSFYFADIEQFRLMEMRSNKLILVDYKKNAFGARMEEVSALERKTMKFNLGLTGSIENLPASNLTMKGEEIFELLQTRLKEWQETEAVDGNIAF